MLRIVGVVLVSLLIPGCDGIQPTETHSDVPCSRSVDAPDMPKPVETAVPSPPIPPLPAVPTPQQLRWQRAEMYLFVHFGINTFTGNDWGDGTEDPALFDPERIDADQWVRTAQAAGLGGLILTAKHHDGFALWPTAYSDHSVAGSPWMNGRGDVVRLVADATRRAGLPFGLYVSPWDRHEPTYGTPAYDDFFAGQLEELLTGYGPIFELWLDSSHGAGVEPAYDMERYIRLVRRLQPETLIANAGPDIRWVGNEAGVAPPTLFSAVDDTRWYPAECDVSIRPSWFWKAHESGRIKLIERLVSIYFQCVGRNGVLLLNVPPGPDGRFSGVDVERLLNLRAALDLIFETNLARDGMAEASNERSGGGWSAQHAVDGNDATFWATEDGVTTATLDVQLAGCAPFNVIALKEPIQYGERVRAYRVDGLVAGRWIPLSRGTSIGHKKLDAIAPVTASRIRLVVESAVGSVAIQELGLYHNPLPFETAGHARR